MKKESGGIQDSMTLKKVYDTKEVLKVWKKNNPKKSPRELFSELQLAVQLFNEDMQEYEVDVKVLACLRELLLVCWILINDENLFEKR